MLCRDPGVDVSEVQRQHGYPESRFVVDALCAGSMGVYRCMVTLRAKLDAAHEGLEPPRRGRNRTWRSSSLREMRQVGSTDPGRARRDRRHRGMTLMVYTSASVAAAAEATRPRATSLSAARLTSGRSPQMNRARATGRTTVALRRDRGVEVGPLHGRRVKRLGPDGLYGLYVCSAMGASWGIRRGDLRRRG